MVWILAIAALGRGDIIIIFVPVIVIGQLARLSVLLGLPVARRLAGATAERELRLTAGGRA